MEDVLSKNSFLAEVETMLTAMGASISLETVQTQSGKEPALVGTFMPGYQLQMLVTEYADDLVCRANLKVPTLIGIQSKSIQQFEAVYQHAFNVVSLEDSAEKVEALREALMLTKVPDLAVARQGVIS